MVESKRNTLNKSRLGVSGVVSKSSRFKGFSSIALTHTVGWFRNPANHLGCTQTLKIIK